MSVEHAMSIDLQNLFAKIKLKENIRLFVLGAIDAFDFWYSEAEA